MVVFRAWPEIESVRSALWEKTGRAAGNLQCLCPKIRLRAWSRMHRNCGFPAVADHGVSGNLFFRTVSGTNLTYSSYKTWERE